MECSEIETIEQRLKSFMGQLQTECGILERLVYKHKNQHRRSSYFQYILKVRRDLKLLKLAKLEEILDASFLVINGNRPRQKLQLLESLKRRCESNKYNFLERLLGATRLLSQMIEPMLKAAMEISTLLAQSFFMKFSLTILAVLARVRVLVQQILLDAVHVYNAVSALSQKEQIIKLNQDGFEVFREYYPRKEEATIVLECVWQSDKYVLVERINEMQSNTVENDHQEDVSLERSNIQYENIEVVLGADESGPADAENIITNPKTAEQNGSKSMVINVEKLVKDASDTVGASSANAISKEDVISNSLESVIIETNSQRLSANDTDSAGPPLGSRSISAESGFPSSTPTSPCLDQAIVKHERKRKVAFVSVKPPAPSTTNQSSVDLKGTKKSKEDPAYWWK